MSSIKSYMTISSVMIGLLVLNSTAAPVLESKGKKTEDVKGPHESNQPVTKPAQVLGVPNVPASVAEDKAKLLKSSGLGDSPIPLKSERIDGVKKDRKLEQMNGIKETDMPVEFDDSDGGSEAASAVQTEDEYMRTLLGNPELLKQVLDEDLKTNYDTYPNDAELDVKPQDMAEYLFTTGDAEGVSRMIDNLVLYGVLTGNEANDFRLAVEAEYSLLADVTDRLVNKFDALQEPVGSSVAAYSDSDYYNLGDELSRNDVTGSSDLYNNYREEEQDYPYYDEILKELLGYLPPSESTRLSVSQLAPARNSEADRVESKLTLENELKALPVREGNKTPAARSDIRGKTGETEEEEELALLNQLTDTGDRKQKQDNRTKSDRVLLREPEASSKPSGKQQQIVRASN